nr:hypothetical protein GCM10020063_042340 [Dactylosporangium thailandense]
MATGGRHILARRYRCPGGPPTGGATRQAQPSVACRSGYPSMPVEVCEAPTGLDSGEPRCRR